VAVVASIEGTASTIINAGRRRENERRPGGGVVVLKKEDGDFPQHFVGGRSARHRWLEKEGGGYRCKRDKEASESLASLDVVAMSMNFTNRNTKFENKSWKGSRRLNLSERKRRCFLDRFKSGRRSVKRDREDFSGE